MHIFDISSGNAPFVAKMMSRIKPDWWAFDGDALRQITSTDMLGWYMGETEDTPVGFICVKEVIDYGCVELQSYGYDDNGEFVTGELMGILYEKVEQYAVSKGFRSVRTHITWTDASFDKQTPTTYAEELLRIASECRELLANETTKRRAFPYLLNRGYYPSALVPNCYGEDLHGLVMTKQL